MIKKLLIIGFVVSLLVNAVAIAVFAATETEEAIRAVLNKSIRLTWNGEEFLPIDPVTHDRVYPIVYNGSTYIPARFIAENAGVEYAIEWINGNVPKEGLDLDALKACIKEYTGTDVSFTAYKENGVTMNNYQLFLMDYLIY